MLYPVLVLRSVKLSILITQSLRTQTTGPILIILLSTFISSFLKVKFLKDLLEAWKSEVEKKPPDLSVEQALKILNLKKKPEE